MRIGVVGINHKLADLKLREALAKACQRRFSPDSSMHTDQAFVLLSTCNRTEIYFYSEDLPSSHTYLLAILRNEVDQEFDQKLYSYFGFDCFQHLCRVTAGLDSAIIAETEIQGQVKAAYEKAAVYIDLPAEVHYLFQKALKIGKQVRFDFPSKPGLPDLEHAIYTMGAHVFKDFLPKILFVGASDINFKILSFLKTRRYRDITLCNRTLKNSHLASIAHGVQILEWEKLSEWQNFDWIICGTKSPNYLITPRGSTFEPIERKLVIDLCVPRNVDPQLALNDNMTLLNIDQINGNLKHRRHSLLASITKAEEIIHTSASYHIRQFKMRDAHKLRLIAG